MEDEIDITIRIS